MKTSLLMDILEMLNTQPPKDIKWTQDQGYINKGTYELDGDIIEIRLEEYDTKFGKTLVDFGFSVNGSIQAKNDPKAKARLIGSILNGAISKLKEINPDVILVSVNKNTGMIESRKSSYSTIISWFMKRSDYTYHHEWVENNEGFYALIAKKSLTAEEELAFISIVNSK